MKINKYLWIREEGKYRKLCRNPEYQEEPCSTVDVMKSKFHSQIEAIETNKRYKRIKKWPQESRDSYVEAKDYEKRLIEVIMNEEPEAKIYLRVMPEMLVLGKTIRMVRTKSNDRMKEVDEVLRSMMRGGSYVR